MSTLGRQYPEEQAARASLVRAISRARYAGKLRGDDLIERYDGAAGREIADQARADLAERIAEVHDGTVEEFCRKVRTSPSRLGIAAREERGQLRGDRLSTWGWDRLCAVAGALDHDVVVTLVPRTKP